MPGRRPFLLALLACAHPARADDGPVRQLSKTEAQYQDTPRGGLRCAGCTLFIKPNACKVVAGQISPLGWCRLFDLVD